ncbi:MAG TPA: protease pro-enzyme activation domain-containing protein, partial [bacterium]|nr:protease pro-enzyme activation domain-containing protein [bacterium]
MRRILLLSLCGASALFAACNDTSIVSGATGQPTTPPVTSPTATLTATPTATATATGTASPTPIASDTPPPSPTPSPTSTLQGVPTPQWTPVVVGDGIPGPLSGVYTDQGPADPAQPFRSLIGFPIRDEAALADRIRNIYDPSSADFRAYLTPAEWDANYAPAADDVELIKEYLVYEGFSVNFEATNHLLLQFSGTVDQFNTAFLADLHVCM